VGFEDIRVGKTFDGGEPIKGRIDAGNERRVLETPENFGVFFFGEIA
jgi:hypothetical protein